MKLRSSLRFSGSYIIIALISLAIGAAIFFFGSNIPFIRYSIGDFVIVIFIYTAIKSFFPSIPPIRLAIGIFMFSLTIEILQYFDVPRFFNTDKAWVQILLGSRFEWLDIAMYLAGLASILWLEKKIIKRGN